MKAAEFWNIDNVKSFRGHDVENGEVSISDSEYVDFLDEIYGDVQVCGMTFGSGSLLQDADPTAFRCGKGDHESSIQSELESQLENEDDSDIDFIDDLDDEENECSDCGGTFEELNEDGICGTCQAFNDECKDDE